MLGGGISASLARQSESAQAAEKLRLWAVTPGVGRWAPVPMAPPALSLSLHRRGLRPCSQTFRTVETGPSEPGEQRRPLHIWPSAGTTPASGVGATNHTSAPDPGLQRPAASSSWEGPTRLQTWGVTVQSPHACASVSGSRKTVIVQAWTSGDQRVLSPGMQMALSL